MKQPDQEEYDDANNEVMWWLAKQPEALQVLINIAHQNHWIVFDKNTHQWHGATEQESQRAKNNSTWLRGVAKSNRAKHQQTQDELVKAYQDVAKLNQGETVTAKQLANELDISRAAVYERIEKSDGLRVSKGKVMLKCNSLFQ